MNENHRDPLSELQDWYAAACNGDWEHSYGVKVDTLDNPGWMLTVDLRETAWERLALPMKSVERSERDWFDYEISDGTFRASGGPRNLEEMIKAFLRIVRTAPTG